MRRWAWVFGASLLLAIPHLHDAGRAEGPIQVAQNIQRLPSIAGTTTIGSSGASVVAIAIEETVTLDSIEFETSSSDVAFYMAGNNANFAQFKTAGILNPPVTHGIGKTLPAGPYHVYLWSSTDLRTKLEFLELEGTTEFEARTPANIQFSNPAVGSPVPDGTDSVIQRYRLDHEGNLPAIAGIVRFEEVDGPIEAGSRAYRWSNSGGTLFCYGEQRVLTGATVNWLKSEWEWFILPELPAGPLRVEYEEAMVQRETRQELRLLSIEQAPGDGAAGGWTPVAPIPALPDNLSFDPACLRDFAGTQVHRLTTVVARDGSTAV